MQQLNLNRSIAFISITTQL